MEFQGPGYDVGYADVLRVKSLQSFFRRLSCENLNLLRGYREPKLNQVVVKSSVLNANLAYSDQRTKVLKKSANFD